MGRQCHPICTLLFQASCRSGTIITVAHHGECDSGKQDRNSLGNDPSIFDLYANNQCLKKLGRYPVVLFLSSVVPLHTTQPSMVNPCESSGICSELHLLDSHDITLRIVQGTKERITLGPLENVVKVQTMGSGGCYTIFEEENFKSEHFCWTGNEKLDLMDSVYNTVTVVR